MDYQSLHNKTVVELRRLAREMQVKIPAGLSKTSIIERLLEAAQTEAAKPDAPAVAEETKAAAPAAEEAAVASVTETAEVRKAGHAVERPASSYVAAESLARGESYSAGMQNTYRAERATPPRPAVQRPQDSYSRGYGENTITRRNPDSAPRRMFSDQRRPQENTYRSNYEMRSETQYRNNNDVQYRENGYRGGEVRSAARAESTSYGRTDYQPRAMAEDGFRPDYDNRYADDPSRRSYGDPEGFRVRRDYAETGPDGMPIGDFADGAGLLELQPDGYGFLRAENCLPGSRDVYISAAQIRRFNLKPGDYVEGKTRPQREGDRYSAMIYISGINGEEPEKALTRKPFDSLIPLYPRERLRMESETNRDLSLRLMDFLAPIGKGQRGMIVSQPKAGKTTLLKKVANAISENNPEVKLIVLLIDERPEEVTDMKRSIKGDVIYSTFDEAPENHTRVAEMVLEHAQRMVEMGKDVVILMDSITRLARAYNLVIPPTGRSLSGGLDPGALYKPKKFFGAARNIEDGGSLTIIATALVDTGSRMDDIIYEEFKGTGNMELHLDRKLSDKRIFPAIDLVRSGTRREELLLSARELEGSYTVRKMLSGGNVQENTEMLLNLMEKSANNDDFLTKIKGWVAVYEKEGFSMG